jgi:hypothetical protein
MRSMLAARGYPLQVLVPRPGLSHEYPGASLITVEPSHLSRAGETLTSFRRGMHLFIFSDMPLWLAVGDTPPSSWETVQVPLTPGGVPVELPDFGSHVYLKEMVNFATPTAVFVSRF